MRHNASALAAGDFGSAHPLVKEILKTGIRILEDDGFVMSDERIRREDAAAL